MELIWTDAALATVDEIADYIGKHFSERIVQRSVERIFHEVSLLRAAPRIGRAVFNHPKYGELRCITIHHNNVYYCINGDIVEVVVVWDYRRSQDELLDRILDFFNTLD